MRPITLLRSALAGLAVLAVAVLATACGSAGAPGSGIHPALHPTTITPGTANPADPRTAATELAHRLLSGLRLPAGSRQATLPARDVRGLPVTGSGFADMVTIKEFHRLRVSMSAAAAWLRRQHPDGAAVNGYGTYGQRGGATARIVNFAIAAPPSWLYSAALYTAVKPAAGGSLLLVQAQVQWYPARSAADHIDPARYASVTVSRIVSQHATSTTLGASTVRSLAAMVNALHAMPDIAISCPAMGGSFPAYRLTFNPHRATNPAAAGPRIVVDPTGCLAVDVTVGGRRVQTLYPASTLITAAQRILRTAARG